MRMAQFSVMTLIWMVSTACFPTLAASVFLNEYNAVSSRRYLDENDYIDSTREDPYFATFEGMPDGRIQGNGGNWIELVVAEDHTDMRGWQLQWAEHDVLQGTNDIWLGDGVIEQGVIRFANNGTWSDLRSGTIITISELETIGVDTTESFSGDRNFTHPEFLGSVDATIDLSTDTSYDPLAGDWWIHVSSLDELDSDVPLVTTETNVLGDAPGNFSVGNDIWQLTIVNAQGELIFGPVGEDIGELSGVSTRDVGKLEGDPSALVNPLTSPYNDGTSSSFGSPNRWTVEDDRMQRGTRVQDFGALRRVIVPLEAGDADQDFDFDQLDIVRVLASGLYLTGLPATWGDGDWDGAPGGLRGSPPAGNGVFDQMDIVAALTADLYLTGPYASTSRRKTEPAFQNHGVPEPATPVLGAVAMICLLVLRSLGGVGRFPTR